MHALCSRTHTKKPVSRLQKTQQNDWHRQKLSFIMRVGNGEAMKCRIEPSGTQWGEIISEEHII